MAEDEMNVLEGEECPMCREKTLTLTEAQRDVPFFGTVYLFSMDCTNCKYHKADVESDQQHDPISVSYLVEKEEDMKVRVVKSGAATLKLPRIMTVEPGESSNGYVTNIEGILSRAKKALEFERDNAEDEEDRKKLKNMIKKLQDVMWGHDSLKITIDDPTGNSMIISEKTEIKKLK